MVEDDAREDPHTLTALIVGHNLELHRRMAEARERLAYLRSADRAVAADLNNRVLSSSSAAALRAAQVSTSGLDAAVRQAIRAGQWSLGQSGSAGAVPSELDRAFRQTASDWREALSAAHSACEELARELKTAFDGDEPYAERMRPGDGSYLAPFEFPQDTYAGAEFAAHPDYSRWKRAFPRTLMHRTVLPDRPWASLPWLDLCDTNLIFVPDGSGLTYSHAAAAAQGLVADQMSKAAPNRLKITWIDALHNGQSAGAFLRLAESGSLIIDGQVWTDPAGIEAALLRVVHRMADLERACLRNEVAHLDAYNSQPEVAPEAHQVVVVSGYPAGFREPSARLLRQISENSARVGISLIVVMDESMAGIITMTDDIAPSYAKLDEGPGPVNAPNWWSVAVLPLGEFVLGHAGRPYARVRTIPQGETVWVPCRLRSVDKTVQASIITGYAEASRQMAELGLSPREMDNKRIDPTARTISLRNAMLGWLHEQVAANQSPPGWDGFLRSDALHRTGITHNLAEIAKQASYLREEGYIDAGDQTPDTSGMSFPRLTPKGEDMAMSGDASAGDFADNSGKRRAGTVNNIHAPVFHGDMSGAQIAVNSRDVTQTQKTEARVTPGFEHLDDAVRRTLAQLPRFGLTAEDREDATASANEILAEVVYPSPDRTRIRRALASLRGFLQPVAAQAALGAGEGSQSLAKAALEHLQSVVF